MYWVQPLLPKRKILPMSKLLAAVRRTFSTPDSEPEVHFHQGTSDNFPEVCHDGSCRRPQLQP
jgi:hypothetical protein